MGKIITLAEAQKYPPGQEKDWLYNTLDVTGTREVADALLPRLNPTTERTYAFERALQNPAFSMMMRGVRVDTALRARLIAELKRELKKDLALIAKMPEVTGVWNATELETGFCPAQLGKHHKWPRSKKGEPPIPEAEKTCAHCGTSRIKPKAFEPNSTDQVHKLFYDLHKIQPITNKKGEISVDDDVLERIGRKHPHLLALTSSIRAVRDKKKQLGSLNARLTPDNRYPSNFNVGAAWTGRFSSSKNPFQQGGNLQNVSERHRAIFIADYGYDMFYLDLKQAESNVVAHLAGDEKYIEAHRSGDVHTYVTRLVWPNLPWTGDLKKDKAIAKQLPAWDNVPGHDFRFQAKRIQHGSNFGLTPPGIAMIAHIPLKEARTAQAAYFRAFPGIKAWQDRMGADVREHKPLVNPLGRTISLFGRPWDGHTLKQGLAFKPQSAVADILDLAMIRVWDQLDPWELHLLAQVHDAMLGQFLEGQLEIVRKAARLMQIPVPVNGRIMIIEPELAVGKNWGHKSKTNPDGIDEVPL